AERYDPGSGTQPAWKPTLQGPLGIAMPGSTVAFSGTLFTGISEASGGSFQSSPSDVPVLWLRRPDPEPVLYALTLAWTPTTASVALTATLPAGRYEVGVVVNGIPSDGLPLVVVQLGQLGSGCGN